MARPKDRICSNCRAAERMAVGLWCSVCVRYYAAQCSGDPGKTKNTKKSPYRAYLEERCSFCGFIPIHPCQLDIDHINGNHKDNRRENLQTLCANCHRLKTLQERL